MAKSLSNAKTGKEGIKHIGRVGRAYRLTKSFCRRADAICEKNEVGKWVFSPKQGHGGEERSDLNERRRVTSKG